MTNIPPPNPKYADRVSVTLDEPKGETKSNNHKDIKSGLVIQRADSIEIKPISWLWPDRIACGKLTIIAGEPGLGKSQLSAYLAAMVTTGKDWAGGEGPAKQGSVVILSAEDDAADTMVPRLMAAGADLSRIYIINAVVEHNGKGERTFNLQADLQNLEEVMKGIGDVRLVSIDPISSYLGKVDSHKNAELRSVLEPVGKMAARCNVAVAGITHLNKAVGGTANHRVNGSIALVAAARAAYLVAADPDNEGRVLFLATKNNLGPSRHGLAFRVKVKEVRESPFIEAPYIEWDSEPVVQSADAVLAAFGRTETTTAKDEAIEFLRTVLADGALPVSEIEDEARKACLIRANESVSQAKPFRDARKALGIEPKREGGLGKEGRWMWGLPLQSTH